MRGPPNDQQRRGLLRCLCVRACVCFIARCVRTKAWHHVSVCQGTAPPSAETGAALMPVCVRVRVCVCVCVCSVRACGRTSTIALVVSSMSSMAPATHTHTRTHTRTSQSPVNCSSCARARPRSSSMCVRACMRVCDACLCMCACSKGDSPSVCAGVWREGGAKKGEGEEEMRERSEAPFGLRC